MRKLLSVVLLFISTIGYGQFPSNANTSNANTQTNFLGATNSVKGAVIGYYADTATANLATYLKGVPNITITTEGNVLWQRNAAANRWVQIGANGANCISNPPIVTWDTLLVFVGTSGTYCINGTQYAYAGGSVTLTAADPSLPRQDAIVVDTLGNMVAIAGTPAADPAVPSIDASSQYFLTSVLVGAGATEPTGVTSVTLWDENLGTPTEWAGSASGLIVAFGNTLNPYHLTRATDVGAFTNGDLVQYIGTPYSSTTYNSVRFFIRLKSTIANNANISVQLLSNSMPVTSPVQLNSNYGFSKTVTGAYQNISMPFSAFPTIFDATTYNGIRFILNGNNASGFYIDYITFNSGTQTTSGNYVTNVFRKQGTDSVFQTINGVNIFAFRDSIGSGSGADSSIFATQYWVKSNAIPITGTDGISGPVTGAIEKDLTTGGTVIHAVPQNGMASTMYMGVGEYGDIENADNFSSISFDVDTSLVARVALAAKLRNNGNQIAASITATANKTDSIPFVLISTTYSGAGPQRGKGIVGVVDYSANYDSLTYVQKDWVDDQIDIVRDEIADSMGTTLQSVVAGTNVTVDNTDPRNPVISASGGGGGSSAKAYVPLLVRNDSVYRRFNVLAYGAIPNDTLSDQTAIQAAINAAYAAGGGTVFFPNGIYYLKDPLLTSGTNIGNPNSQLYLRTDTLAGVYGSVIIALEGETPPSPNASALANYAINRYGVIIYSTIQGSGTYPSIFGADGLDYGGGFSLNMATLSIKNMNFRVKANIAASGPTMSALNLKKIAFIGDIVNVVCDIDTSTNLSVYPSAETFGIYMPQTGNGASSPLNNVLVTGYKYGYIFPEHSTGNNITAYVCEHAFVFPITQHASSFQRLTAQWCKYSLSGKVGTIEQAGSPKAPLKIQQLDIEWQPNTYGNWFDTRYIVYDSTNVLWGDFTYHMVKRGVGVDNSAFNELGGANIEGYKLGPQDSTQILVDAGTVTFDASIAKNAQVTIAGNRQLAITNFRNGTFLSLVVIQDGTGGRTLTPVSGSRGTHALSTSPNQRDILTFFKIDDVIYFNGKAYNTVN